MRPPLGLSYLHGHVCCFCHAFYGLKESGHAWYERFQLAVLQIGFHSSTHDFSLSIHHYFWNGHSLVVHGWYDYHWFRHCCNCWSQTTSILQIWDEKFGLLRYFLAIEVASSPKGYLLSRPKYANEIIIELDSPMINLLTPLLSYMPNSPLQMVCPLEDPTLYHQLGGCLVYLTVTHPHIVYAVHVVSQFNPCTLHYSLGCFITHLTLHLRYYIQSLLLSSEYTGEKRYI